ncbi:MAG TPA: xanthine dehydrogenase family protein molybdopterin-binding subunit, partial [bacterium]|nr:xanthine dehydrogenase family protein molybdopterin-binding subunit [bacterium]
MLHLALVRSPHAHARIRTVDAAGAIALSGVSAVITAADLEAPVPRIAVRPTPPDLDALSHPLLADGITRYVGEPVAAVLAGDRYEAEDAVDRVRVEYEILPAVSDVETAIAPGAPVL